MAEKFQLNVNGKTHAVTTDSDRSLLHVLREDLDLTGTKFGCGESSCGACTVLLDSKPTRSCVTPVSSVGAKHVVTIEGLATGDTLHPVQAAFLEADAMQCGYCTSGMILATVGLLHTNPHPDEAAIRAGLQGNVCRCGTYRRILRAVQIASRPAQKESPK